MDPLWVFARTTMVHPPPSVSMSQYARYRLFVVGRKVYVPEGANGSNRLMAEHEVTSFELKRRGNEGKVDTVLRTPFQKAGAADALWYRRTTSW